MLANKYQYNDLLIRSQDPYANAKYEVLLEWLEKENVNTILNAGCGSGEFSFILASHGYEVVGIDMDKDYIDLAKKNGKRMGFNKLRFEVSSIEKFCDNTKFDVVMATDVLEHIEDDKFAFLSLTTHAKIGGLVICTIPAGQYLFGFHDAKLGHYRRYTLDSFKKILPKNIVIKKLRYFGFFLIPVALAMSKFIKKSYPVVKSNNNKLLNYIFQIEKRIEPVLGTSVLFLGKKT
jgi:2-polyprenyl-3-methyl-5-hydroxy-6-metoxy-1,4-benzoquinol methylase